MTFLSKQPSPEIAAKTLEDYEAYMKAYGKILEKRKT